MAQAIESAVEQEASFDYEVVVGGFLNQPYRCNRARLRRASSQSDSPRPPGREPRAREEPSRHFSGLSRRVHPRSWTATITGRAAKSSRSRPDFSTIIRSVQSSSTTRACCRRRVVLRGELHPARNHPPSTTIDQLFETNFIATCSVMLRRSASPPAHPRLVRDVVPGRLAALRPLRGPRPANRLSGRADGRLSVHKRGLWSGLNPVARLERVVEFLGAMNQHYGRPPSIRAAESGALRRRAQIGARGAGRPLMKRMALLQFHRDLEVAANRLRLLEDLNPKLADLRTFRRGGLRFRVGTSSLRCAARGRLHHLEASNPRWKWQNTNLGVLDWFRGVGRHLAFDVLHVIQWDLLLLDSLDNLYARVPTVALGLTGVTPLRAIADRWHWTRVEPHRTELVELGHFVAARFGAEPPDRGVPWSRLLSAAGVSRSLREDRCPGARARRAEAAALGKGVLGFPVADTGFYPRWLDGTRSATSTRTVRESTNRRSGRNCRGRAAAALSPVPSRLRVARLRAAAADSDLEGDQTQLPGRMAALSTADRARGLAR